MTLIDSLGTVAATLTTLSFLPQAVLVLRTRNTQGISLVMYGLFTAGLMLWGIYGLLLGAWPIIISNGITFVLAALILTAVIKDRLRARRQG